MSHKIKYLSVLEELKYLLKFFWETSGIRSHTGRLTTGFNELVTYFGPIYTVFR